MFHYKCAPYKENKKIVDYIFIAMSRSYPFASTTDSIKILYI